ncbi:GMC oxidoreductase [Macrolepiota fuliginosa MF-IS2]|uniref:pyranose dehydrogenase (acceptor) n=1 Tax=Macrolepiota fuliginosa MF-IS2 TaxID=1400762 RepID=A0A9P5X691_9AGAR|nr:GMC oxidoreductase [Macrolepiota fuliginosa MF-IS2]
MVFLRLALILGLGSVGLCTTYSTIQDVPNIKWDFIIVGGGTAGSALAGRLTENPKFDVLVIEAGPTNEGVEDSIIPGLGPKTLSTRYDWNFTTVPQQGLNGRSIPYQRGHLLGGTSSVNGMVYTRGPASDYDRLARISGDSGWSWENIQSYLMKNEKLEQPSDNHDVEGELDPTMHSSMGKVAVTLPNDLSPAIDAATLQASKELGGDFQFNIDMNSGKPLGVGWMQSTIGHDGTRSSSATSYLDNQTRGRKNLHIVTDTFVTRVLKTPGAKGLTIRSVEIRSSNASEAVILTAFKEVILASGTIGTPHILLHSGIGDERDLKALNIETVLHNPSVGRNFTDHPGFFIPFSLAPNSIDMGPWVNLSTDPALQAQALYLWKTNRTGPYVQYIPGHHIAWLRLPENSSIIKQFGDPSSSQESAHIELMLGMSGRTYNAILLMVSPASRGSLTIKSNNPFDNPLIDPGYYSSQFDLLTTREGIKSAVKFSKAPVWENVITGLLANATTDAEIDAFIRNNTVSGLHPVGTAAMSSVNASWGVVDPDLLVKRVSGLRIVDASVLPYVPSAHTQVIAYVVAERAADMIKDKWRDVRASSPLLVLQQ